MRLTVDLPTQQIAEESLTQGMDGARTLVDPDSGNYYEANAGAVVVLDARTGSVVAMASNPSFDPNDFISGNADQYFAGPQQPAASTARSARYAPGSTFKTITSIAMLQSGLVPRRRRARPTATTRTAASTSATTRSAATPVTRCSAPSTSRRALTVSSDVYFYTVGNEFWKAYRDEGQAKDGTPATTSPATSCPTPSTRSGTRSSTPPARTASASRPASASATSPASIPDHEFRVKLNPNDDELQIWRRGDNTSLAVGQGDVLVTPLQLANAYAAFANGGTLYQPRLADEVTQSSAGLPAGQLGQPVEPRSIRW